MRDLEQLAAEMDVTIVTCRLGGLRGLYDHRARAIYLDDRLTGAQRCSTLAHELGHAHHGDHDLVHMTVRRRRDVEERATRWAARMLISPVEYAAAELVAGSDPVTIARELGVTRRLVEAWREWADGIERTA
jgi:Zn-dependent peptidase ImmA (M78 family)